MKRIVFVLSILVTIICLMGCSQDASVQTGTLEININSDVSRGIQAISMETASYNVTIKDSSENVVFSSSGKTQTTYTVSVLAGTYTAYVEALNSDGDVIGTGSSILAVVAGQVNSFSITVSEVTGNGTFSISITANEGYSLSYSVKDASGTEVKSGALTYGEGTYSASESFASGFYTFTITRTDTNKVLKYDSVRIISGKAASYRASFQFLSDGSVVIVNEITATPAISISLSATTLQVGDTLTVSATISGITGEYTCYWTVDGEAVTEEGVYSDLEFVIPETEETDHEVALFVKSGSIIWSSCESFVTGDEYFRIGFIDPDFDPENTTWFVDKAEGDSFMIRMEDDDSAIIYYPQLLDTYFRSVYGWFPNSGNPFNFYCTDQMNMTSEEFVKALCEDSSIILPYPNYTPHLSHPYIITEEDNIPANITISDVQSIYADDKGYYRSFETNEVFGFPVEDRIYVGVARSGANGLSYKILVPEEVTRVYKEKYPEKTYRERVALYFAELYGIEVLDDNKLLFTMDQISTVLSEYRSPNLVRIRIVVQPTDQGLAESLEGTRGFVDVGSKLLGCGPLNNTEGWDYIYYEDFEDGDVLTISPWQGYQDDEDVIHRCDVPTCKIVSLSQDIAISSDKVNTIYLQVKSLEGSDELILDYDTDFYVTDYPYTIPQGEAGEKYVIDVAEANDVSYDCYGSNLPVYTTTGLHRNNFIPIPSQLSKHFVMYIGEITDEMRFRISAFARSNNVNDYGTFRIRQATAEELAYITEMEVSGKPFEITLDLEERASFIRRYVLSGAEEVTSVALFYSTDGENYIEYDRDTVGFHIGFRSGDINGTSTGYSCTCGGNNVLTSSYPIEVVEIDGRSNINGKLKIVLN